MEDSQVFNLDDPEGNLIFDKQPSNNDQQPRQSAPIFNDDALGVVQDPKGDMDKAMSDHCVS